MYFRMCMPVNRGPESIIYDSLSTIVPTSNVHFVYVSIKEDDEYLQEKNNWFEYMKANLALFSLLTNQTMDSYEII